MCGDVSNPDERIQLYFDFGLHGWSELIFVCQGQISVFRISGVFTDAPTALLDICDAVLTNAATRVALCDEPGGVVVEVTPDTKQQHTVILSVYEIAPPMAGFDAHEVGRLVMATRLKRRRLVGMLLTELWKSHKFPTLPIRKIEMIFPTPVWQKPTSHGITVLLGHHFWRSHHAAAVAFGTAYRLVNMGGKHRLRITNAVQRQWRQLRGGGSRLANSAKAFCRRRLDFPQPGPPRIIHRYQHNQRNDR